MISGWRPTYRSDAGCSQNSGWSHEGYLLWKPALNYSKGLGNSSFSCLHTDLVEWYQSQDTKQKHGVKENPKYRITNEHLCILLFWLPVWNIHSPNLRAKAVPVSQSHNMNIVSKPLEEKGQTVWNHKQILTKNSIHLQESGTGQKWLTNSRANHLTSTWNKSLHFVENNQNVFLLISQRLHLQVQN